MFVEIGMAYLVTKKVMEEPLVKGFIDGVTKAITLAAEAGKQAAVVAADTASKNAAQP
jgi:hypothetical protein